MWMHLEDLARVDRYEVDATVSVAYDVPKPALVAQRIEHLTTDYLSTERCAVTAFP